MNDHIKMDWNSRYIDGNLPWDTNRHDINLEQTLETFNIKPCPALEIGCGTGTNSLWLAERGFTVTALDISEKAIKMACEKADQTGLNVSFRVSDIMTEEPAADAYQLVFDRGCFHSFDTEQERTLFATRVARCLSTDGYWLSLIGSTDGPDRDMGPPRLSATEITRVIEPMFEIISLVSSHFDSSQEEPPRNWVCLSRKR